ncbi:Maltodextrin phosphorylase [Marinomonas gallaica]|uniref:Alpha-1,4 glucan phosphorylase n=1 Tax=Marinomonas gallaica TaxID=1806667 RepID=A0A1C3JPJ0_9GAMM|nr:glycogen/starch/alpha-glucan phosphorylase [Marinomonas gallaica]SBT16939.1 Maltodextrin phosphorylase [Marinomonas gallaica]SBT22110.1 Maltodextrin phosphorylase [Marinomonas gallaica]
MPNTSQELSNTNTASCLELKEGILYHMRYTLALRSEQASKRDWWLCLSLAVRDRIIDDMVETQARHNQDNVRRLYYLSMEYLMGRMLVNNVHNIRVFEQAQQAITELGQNWDEICDEEMDMGLGNGGLGRLAACFLDSLATLDLPAVGYGIYYEFGLFKQAFQSGKQVEHPDTWINYGTPWELVRPEYAQTIQFYGRVEESYDSYGNYHPLWVETKNVLGIPHDIPVAGYDTKTVNFLRLWSSRSTEDFDLDEFNKGDYVEAVRSKAIGETISKVLYPNDTTENGKELRLVQQYFFVACSLADILRRFERNNGSDWEVLAEKAAIQLNDTHPAIAVVELMRILVDDKRLHWDQAWSLVTRIFAYTNHTLLPEALETWSVALFEKVLPRHLQFIYEINHRLMDDVEARWPGRDDIKQALSIIEEGHGKMVRMAHLAVVGSHKVNGVAALHSQLLKTDLFARFDEFYPGKFTNKTNGITPRRWLLNCNSGLAQLFDQYGIESDWPKNLDRLRKLENFADEPEFQQAFMKVKLQNKQALTQVIKAECGVDVDPNAMFDVQIKRLHEYKRQHLTLLNILTLYHRLLNNPDMDMVPRVFIFGAKAAPGYALAKTIIYAINAVAEAVNNDVRIQGKLKVVFLPNYRVSLAAKIIPAADLSEQISTAGKEASGTGNMKLALNGALTIGTLDGANVEIQEEVGDENIFIFGLKIEDVQALDRNGYNPYDYYYGDEELRNALDWLCSGYFSPYDPHAFDEIRRTLLDQGDRFKVLVDYRAYVECQERVSEAYRDQNHWAKMAILNTARMAKFSSDRTIQEYADEIWHLPACPI